MFFNSRAEENTKKFTSARIAFYYRSPFPFSCHYLPSLSSLLSISTSSLSPPLPNALFLPPFLSILFFLHPLPQTSKGQWQPLWKQKGTCLFLPHCSYYSYNESGRGIWWQDSDKSYRCCSVYLLSVNKFRCLNIKIIRWHQCDLDNFKTLYKLISAHSMIKCLGKISLWNCKRLLRKLQTKIYFLPHQV